MTPETIKNTKTTLGVLGGLGLLYLIFKGKIDGSSGITDPTGNGTYVPTTELFNAKSVATDLYDAMKDSGTDEEAILETLKRVNQSQFAQVVSAFGLKYYNTTLGNQYNINPFSPLPKLGLKVWLKEEMSAKEYVVLRNKYPNSL